MDALSSITLPMFAIDPRGHRVVRPTEQPVDIVECDVVLPDDEFSSKKSAFSRPTSTAQIEDDSLIETTASETAMPSPDIHMAGMNGALKRWQRIETQAPAKLTPPGFVPSWKPFWPKLKTVCLTFPEGIELLPPREPPKDGDLKRIDTPRPKAESENSRPKKSTRIRPPSDALSLEDRLFYLLQPPLESWLRGQELIMPFEPFPYQYEGIAWLFSQKAALLADEMGLGKTMQTITALRLLLRSGQVRRVLMVCPKPLIPNWQREFKLWAEEIPITTMEGDVQRRKLMWRMPGSFVMLANYELVTRDFQEMLLEANRDWSGDPDLEHLAGKIESERILPKFDLVVLDEAQRIKNRDSLTAATARAIPRDRSLCLTGTPIENRPEELVSLFEFMGVVPARAEPDVRQLSRLSRDFILRRTKDLVMKDMPPRLDRDSIIELAPAQRAAYDQAEKEGIVRLNDLEESISIQHVFELVLRLKQITNYDPLTNESSKLDRLQADMDEIAACGGKAILFSQWTKTLDWLSERLTPYNPLIYHGGVPTKKREPILAEFKEDPSKHILLMSYGTGAVGLNLQFAGYVFLYDRWWNPAIEDQAINRAHRIGCKSQVIVSRLICKDTIEERIDKVLQQKRELFARVLGEGDNENASLSLTANEIFGLFDLKARNSKGAAKSIGPKAA